MRRVMVRYQLKPERVVEHERLLAAVFTELSEKGPAGLRYGAFKESDGVSFVHVALIDVEGNPLGDIGAFRAFTADVAERCDEPPRTVEYTEVASFRL